MLKKTNYFRLSCVICISFLLLILVSPTIMLFYQSASGLEPKTATSSIIIPEINGQKPAVISSSIEYKMNRNILLIDGYSDNLIVRDKPIYDLYTVAQRIEKKLPTALPPLSPYYGEKVVYLTFDDGPDPEVTPLVLDILKKFKIKATFFVLGTQIEKYPDILKQTFQAGHAIGNHSYNHIYRELYQSADSYIGQLRRNDDVIKKVIGVRPLISRAPGGSAGSFTKEYWERLKSDGYIEVGWNISSGDASAAKAQQIVKNIIYQMNNKTLWSHAIVLMHDGPGHTETVKALPNIIFYFMERGFDFRVVNLNTPPAW